MCMLLSSCYLSNANPNAVDSEGNNGLHILFRSFELRCIKSMAITRMLIDRGICPNSCNNEGYAPFHLACVEEQINAVKYMIFINLQYKKEVFNFNLQDKINQDTGLHIACRYGSYDIIIALGKTNSNPLLRNLNYQTPLQVCQKTLICTKIISKFEKDYHNSKLNKILLKQPVEFIQHLPNDCNKYIHKKSKRRPNSLLNTQIIKLNKAAEITKNENRVIHYKIFVFIFLLIQLN